MNDKIYIVVPKILQKRFLAFLERLGYTVSSVLRDGLASTYLTTVAVYIDRKEKYARSYEEYLTSASHHVEVDIYSFLLSNGQLDFMPMFGELIKLSNPIGGDDRSYSVLGRLNAVAIGGDGVVSYWSDDQVDWYTSVKSLESIKKQEVSETLYLSKFLESHGLCWEDFKINCKVENQRWADAESYYNGSFKDLCKAVEPAQWILKAFLFRYSHIFDEEKLSDVNRAWMKACRRAKDAGQEIKVES